MISKLQEYDIRGHSRNYWVYSLEKQLHYKFMHKSPLVPARKTLHLLLTNNIDKRPCWTNKRLLKYYQLVQLRQNWSSKLHLAWILDALLPHSVGLIKSVKHFANNFAQLLRNPVSFLFLKSFSLEVFIESVNVLYFFVLSYFKISFWILCSQLYHNIFLWSKRFNFFC